MSKRIFVTIAIVAVVVLAGAWTTQDANAQSAWTAQYFNNTNLSGSPAFSQVVNAPSANYGGGAPAPGIGADNFSIRFSSTQILSAGDYQINVQADDGVRVFVDGVLVLNRFSTYTGQADVATFRIPTTGNHTFVIEYFEGGGNAFINYSLNLVSGYSPVQPHPGQGGGNPAVGAPRTATVNTSRLNLRDVPSAAAGNVLRVLLRGQVYTIIGQNNDASWLQIDANGLSGWVNSNYVIVGDLAGVPVTQNSIRPVEGTATILTGRLNVRNAPSGAIITRVSRGDTYPVLGRNADASWVQINVNGTVGWISSRYVRLPGISIYQLPITG